MSTVAGRRGEPLSASDPDPGQHYLNHDHHPTIREVTVTTTTTALLLLDYQRALCEPGDHCLAPPLAEQAQERDVLSAAEDALSHARASDDTSVVHVRLAFDPSYELRTNRTGRFQRYPDNGLLQADDAGAEIMEQVAPLTSEPLVTKGGVNPFIGTPLLEMLLGKGVRRVVLGGVATNLVVESAARHAADSGVDVVVLEDLCASFSPEMHTLAIEKTLPLFAEITSSAEWIGS